MHNAEEEHEDALEELERTHNKALADRDAALQSEQEAAAAKL